MKKKRIYNIAAGCLAGCLLIGGAVPAGAEVVGNSDSLHALGSIMVKEDENLTLRDAQQTLKFALKILRTTDADMAFAADINGDGEVTLKDAQTVLKAALKIDRTTKANCKAVSEDAVQALNCLDPMGDTILDEAESTVLKSAEELAGYVSGAGVSAEHAAEILEAYEPVYEKNAAANVLAIQLPVTSSQLSCSTYINGNHVLCRVNQCALEEDTVGSVLTRFIVLGDEVDAAKLKTDVVYSSIERDPDAVLGVNSSDNEGSGKIYTDLIKTSQQLDDYVKYTDETLGWDFRKYIGGLPDIYDYFYREFWGKQYADVASIGGQYAFYNMYSCDGVFDTSAYVAVTFDSKQNPKQYEVQKLYVEDQVLHVDLKKKTEDAEESAEGNIMFIRVPQDAVRGVTEVVVNQ